MTMYTAMKKYPQDATLFNENELHLELLVVADLHEGGALIKTLHIELCLRIIPRTSTQRLLFTHFTSSPPLISVCGLW